MDNDSVVMARIPNPNAGPPFMTTASEVATMEFARDFLDIPVPKVLAWNGNIDNPAESEYILMEAAIGTQLSDIWEVLELSSKLKIVQDIVAIEQKFLSLSFTRYGNLYFSSDAFPGCEKAKIIGDLPLSTKQEIERRFVIGPVVDRDFWHRDRASMDISRGPWNTASDYLRATARRELNWLHQHAAAKPPGGLITQSEAQRTPEAHIALYEKFLKVADSLLPKGELVRPTLWHWDIHAPNMFVKDGRVTSLIDWQDTWIGPLFLQARHPRLVRYVGELMLRPPESFKSMEDGEEKMQIQTQVEKSTVMWSYETETKLINPLLHEILHIYQGQTRRDTVDFATNTWDGDIIPFRQCLIRVARHWDEIDDSRPCPITFSTLEIQTHQRDGEGWNDLADFWDELEGFVQRDGWTLNENYERALEMFAHLREQGLLDLSGKERDDFEKSTRWAVRL
ncbi:hypothetical protein T440DRAFT_395295 [Plenodomus tracheiphilus IPT5]|uniref:Aminoglycoside phosphotransferase domain-containing protein n=1 Tax=Plenodomus tracheiphilus IPT5 TaxID=1408161 RepID=A0A6A7B7F1_9PLEO|nr:hypothetical protein T440DRAFT_395295 [Plenodomus tracheiphilus IPT5]